MVTKSSKVGVVITLVLFFGLGGAFMARTGRSGQRATGSAAAAPTAQTASTPSVDGIGSQPAGTNSPSNSGISGLGMKSKGGGGTVAVVTFLVLLGLWCLRGWWIRGRNLPHRS
jgi:hypothetical protein